MSYYDVQSWQQSPVRQASWDQPAAPSRSGTSSAMQRDDPTAFWLQLDEVDRALDNLAKSGKLFGLPARRDSVPVMAATRAYAEYDPRLGGVAPRPHSISDFDPMRSPSASNLQNFYASQRFQPRHNEAEQMQQAKRRMAAQRERELRNYHQEQQYNRKLSTQGKSERSISPNSANEEDRRELIARQHRALYGNEGPNYYDPNNFGADNHTPRPNNQAPGAPGSAIGGRGPSPMAYNGFGINHEQKPTSATESAQQYNTNDQSGAKGPSPKPHQSRSRANSTSSPASNPQNFSLFDNAQQSSRTSTSSPGGSPPRPVKSSTGPIGSSVAPIGTRPAQNQASNPALNKRSTTPLPSPLSYGFAPNEVTGTGNNNSNERSTSAASNPPAGAKESSMSNMNWGSSSGVWGKNPLGVQTSVW